MVKLTLEKFIKKANEVHGNKFSYDNVNYINNKTKVIITCGIHGNFEQAPNHHIKGYGCPVCSGKRCNTNEFIKKCVKIHGCEYNYDKVNYFGVKTKVIITCKIHGDFKQNPFNHLQGYGCLKCSGKESFNTNTFIEKAILIHGNKFIYDDVNYKNISNKISIKCKEHGEFKQTPKSHLEGHGCPKCNISKGELEIENILKENNIYYKPQYTFFNLKYKQRLQFDFGILDINGNLKYLIEFNGKQHYELIERFYKTENDFKIAQYKDKLKQEYCVKNNIPLFIIKYNENISDKLKDIINGQKESTLY